MWLDTPLAEAGARPCKPSCCRPPPAATACPTRLIAVPAPPAPLPPPQEFISLRQAHDQRLIESTDISRRVSLLDERSQAASGPQIMSQTLYKRFTSVQLRASSASLDPGGLIGSAPAVLTAPHGGGSSGGGKDGGSEATDASDAPLARNPYLGSSTLARRRSSTRAVPLSPASDPGSLPRILSSKAGSVPSELLQQGSGSDPAHPGLVHRHASSARTSEGSLASVPGSLPPSPFADSAAAAPPGAGLPRVRTSAHRGARPSLQRITDEGEEGGGGDDVERQGGQDSWVPSWDELAQPLPLVDAADAAAFYTVLIVDEAVESFAYRWVRWLQCWGSCLLAAVSGLA